MARRSKKHKEMDKAFRRWVEVLAAIKNASESPIEQSLGWEIAKTWMAEIGGPLHLLVGKGPTAGIQDGLTIVQQMPFFGYRLDFMLYAKCPDGTFGNVIVECDGHDFHERTKEQAARDRKRDRDLAITNTRLLRFTGSEIYKDANGCAREALVHLGITQYPDVLDGQN